MKLLAYRMDGGPEAGLGHVARALAVTEAARRRGGWCARWASAGGPQVEVAARAANAELVRPAPHEGEDRFLQRAADGAAVLVIDRKLPYNEQVVAALKAARPVMLLDVVCNGMFRASATVFPTAHLDPAIAEDPRWGKGGRLLHGREWVVVHPRVRAVERLDGAATGGHPMVVITTGGSDPASVSFLALDWLDRLDREVAVELLVGAANPRRGELMERAGQARHPTVVLDDPDQFPARLAAATVALATFGVTAYELAYLGVPALLVSHNQENAEGAARFAKWGSAEDLGLAEQVPPDHALSAMVRLLDDPTVRARMREAGRRLVDGRGAERVAELIDQLACGRSR